ncbi:DnaA regulatory inactivator Hda [Phaeovibrio sulfidiphilus]|uniref:DnaA regulatory inactivator Hda n=2 Tax=Phaeovibrio sulfidiphilus TaxID=1220600 RepID=A0A8J6YQA4_9PROT|nr:DnaA regulatory inactivator Hda [Phaeovibrio sulfidiphilus]
MRPPGPPTPLRLNIGTGAEQLCLDLPLPPALGREHYMVGDCNRAAVALVDLWPDWPSRVLLLHGPAGAGKTHLARVFATCSEARILTADILAVEDPVSLFQGASRAAVLEDVDRLLGSGAVSENLLFHLVNAATQESGTVLMTARTPPAAWTLHLPDLRTRLKGALSCALEEPDDALFAAVVLKHFDDRGIRISRQALNYLLLRLERRLSVAREVVRRADAAALGANTSVNISILKKVLEDSAPPEDSAL